MYEDLYMMSNNSYVQYIYMKIRRYTINEILHPLHDKSIIQIDNEVPYKKTYVYKIG